ncbi:hypothetical protein SALWKB12_1679 [Snodgrassella communis]|uniref:Uncharacterized protein n=1 Tax=Snodgrassella communis TaxID=2946699 RepID=A0A836MR50_9NEIS|nr:hypothetical protein SALWKB12_1679 [Snodgrassella communis]KDN14630.1 hypothetical protein SALWKB29_1420 [Snodgrassella communis]
MPRQQHGQAKRLYRKQKQHVCVRAVFYGSKQLMAKLLPRR